MRGSTAFASHRNEVERIAPAHQAADARAS
jgi:hypothetical protein